MIEHPAQGQRIILRYAAHKLTGRRPAIHKRAGEVLAIWNSRGPRNVAVRLDGLGVVIVHRGNLFVEPVPNARGEKQAVFWA